MRSLQIKQVDVFTDVPYSGNPVAVLFGADDLTDEEMLRIASWVNWSETAFVTRSERADYVCGFSPQDRNFLLRGTRL